MIHPEFTRRNVGLLTQWQHSDEKSVGILTMSPKTTKFVK